MLKNKINKDFSEETNQLLSKLTPRQREIIQLRADGYSYKEIAETLGIKEQSVANEIQRLKKRMSSFNPRIASITGGRTLMIKKTIEYYLNQIEPELKQKAYVYWRDWEIKGIEWQDLAQELRIHLSNKFDTWEKKSSFRTWANRIMLNKIKDICRDNYTNNDVLDQPNTLSTDELREKGLDINNYGEIVKNRD